MKRKRSIPAWLAGAGVLAALAGPAGAWQPSGWVYHDHPWAYESATGDWHWFNPDTQWVVNMSSGAWATLPESALASGWVFYDWAYAYAQGNGAWHWINEPDWQWVVNMRTGEWSRFGAAGGRARLTWADVVAGFQGTFGVPLAEEGDFRFGYSSGVHAQLENGDLLVDGHPYYDRQARVQVPAVLDGREGVRTGGWIDLTGGLKPPGWTEGDERIVLGGLLQVTGRIHFTKHQWYNGSGTNWPTQGHYDGALDGSGTASGLWGVDNGYAHHSRAGGYVSEPPEALRAAGYPYLAGLEGTSGAALGRWGPNLFAVRSEVSGGKVPAATLLCHPSEALQAPAVRASNATSAWWEANRPANENWWIANKVTDLKWIETGTRRGVLGFVYRGIGNQWYGASDGEPGLPDPYGGGSGYHAEGWALQAWIYDPEDLMAVYRGERDPWSLAPVEVVLLTERLPGAGAESHYSVFGGSARAELKASVRGNRLIVLQENGYPANEWENTPKGYVFTLP